jgi:hypothetical protein
MEIKVVIYIIGGILYFLYSVGKKAQEKEKQKSAANPPVTTTEPETVAKPKPIRPPAYNPLEDVMREVKRKQEAIEAQKKLATPQPTFQKSSPPKDILIHEKKKATFGEGANDSPVYERDLVASEKTVRGDIKLKNEGVYRVETMEEARALADTVETSEYEFDAKQAFIGSIIFERKY